MNNTKVPLVKRVYECISLYGTCMQFVGGPVAQQLKVVVKFPPQGYDLFLLKFSCIKYIHVV